MSEEIIRYVNAACEGDTTAIGMLYTKTLRTSYYLALKLSNDKGSAAEILKKAYARAFCTIGKLKKAEAFEIWMKQNVAAVYKEGQSFTFGEADAAAEESSIEFLPEEVIESREKCEAILKAVSDLKPEIRIAIVLHYYCGMPVTSLAKFLGVSESTANSLLASGRESILASCDAQEPSETLPGVLPVLTRLFQVEASNCEIDGKAVRDVFAYSLEIFNSFKANEKEKAPEAAKTGYFNSNADDDGLSIPQKSVGENAPHVTAEEIGIDFDRFVDTPDDNQSRGKVSVVDALLAKAGIKKLNFKVVIAAVVALLIVIIGISAIVSAVKNKNSNPGSNPAVSQSIDDSSYTWNPGGFEECRTIEYLDENACVFKSATTGKYGLLDYSGNVVLEPNYDGFERCSSGRDYSSRGSYHTLVKIGNDDYEVIYGSGTVSVSNTPHSSHSLITDDKNSDSYDERDRYFNGYAAARKNGKWGYVNQEKDKKVIPYEYDAVNDLKAGESALCDYCRPVTANGLIPVKQNGKMGIINLDNKIVVPFEYDNIMPGSNGVFMAQKDGTWGVILIGSAITSFRGVNIQVSEALDPGYVDESAPTKYFVVADDGANIRKEADATVDTNVIAVLSSGDEVEGYGTKTAANGKEWLIIKYNDEYAYISMSVLQKVANQ